MKSERSGRWSGWLLTLGGCAVLGWAWPRTGPAPRPAAAPAEQWFAALGPVAGLAADAGWLRLNLAWEQQDEAAVRAWIAWVLAAEPATPYFRLNAARMLAFDLPAWRVRAERDVPAAVERAWRTRAADEALSLLAGREEPLLLIESANILLYGRGDRLAAAALYRRAAELPRAPWHAGRIYAQLLREAGRDREALDWLRAWWPRLPADDPAAQRDLVQQRIAELELELRSRGEPL